MKNACLSLRWSILALAALPLMGIPAAAGPPDTAAALKPETLSAALSGNEPALQSLRAAGPEGLEALMGAASKQIGALRRNTSRLEAQENAELRHAIDTVAGQRDAYASGLYWFTDLDAAKAEAKRLARPILSLRLLGNLNEEYSCANSRFFRTILYANAGVSRMLRENYVLHWKSVRPAPLLTIDMGDGRRIKRTITGNSIHYILDPEGNVVDALPGVYSPQAFLSALKRSRVAPWPAVPFRGVSMIQKLVATRIHYPQLLADLRAWHGREAHNLCMEWLAASVRADAYGDSFTSSGESLEEKVNRLVSSAFPGSSGLTADKLALKEGLGLPEWQALRFGEAASSGQTPVVPGNDPVTDPIINGRVSYNPETPGQQPHEIIREFPYPTEFDPPKAMVERPAVQKALNGGTADAAMDPASPADASAVSKTETTAAPPKPEFPAPAEFDPPQIPKAMVERPILQKSLPQSEAVPAQDPASPVVSGPSLAERMTPALWSRIAEPLRASVALDESSRRLMMQKLPEEILLPAETSEGAPYSMKTPFGRQLHRFEEAIARDMVRNEYYYHNRIHQWLEEDKDGSLSRDVEALNRRVYAELFLTPDHDAWLGLVPDDTYTALEKDGCACDKSAPPMRRAVSP